MLCHRAQADTDICGNKRVTVQLCVHTYCQLFATGLFPQEDTGHFLLEDTKHIIREAAKKSCFICCKMGASITCCETSCHRTFHLPCAPDGECVTQYFGTYRSFCWEHRPQQALQPRPSQDNTCSICLDTVEDKISYKTMGCPACQDAFFHRRCIQRLALHSGIAFRCPCCLNQELFMMEMLTMGIRLAKRLASPSQITRHQAQAQCQPSDCPGRLLACAPCPQFQRGAANGTGREQQLPGPAWLSWPQVSPSFSGSPPPWQSDQEVGPSQQRHGRCDAVTCLCPGGREHAEADGLASFELKFAQHQPLAELPPLEQSVEQVQTPEQWISGTQWPNSASKQCPASAAKDEFIQHQNIVP
ncbi:hypothetical protein TURU_167639 [Turdus rufiventris]|nr:hypothetical protein TURU_167639 [Turdus rufiventris]